MVAGSGRAVLPDLAVRSVLSEPEAAEIAVSGSDWCSADSSRRLPFQRTLGHLHAYPLSHGFNGFRRVSPTHLCRTSFMDRALGSPICNWSFGVGDCRASGVISFR